MESLDDYTLLEIFSHLDGNSLKNCAQVCKRFDKVIGESVSTMKSFKLNFDGNRELNKDKLCEILNLKRHYHTIRFDRTKITQKISKSLKSQQVHLRVMEIINTEITESLFKNLMSKLKVLEKLLLIDSTLIASNKKKDQQTDVARIPVPSLKTLVFANSSWKFFAFIGETQLQELKIHHRYLAESKYFTTFLSHQNTIESLALRVNDAEFYKLLSNDESKNYTFHLKKLSLIYNGWGRDEACDKALIDFLEVHKETLEYLETDKKLSDEMYNFIFNDLKLKSMIINVSSIPNSNSNNIFRGILKNLHLKMLTLIGKTRDFAPLQALLNVYRNVEDLRIDELSESIANDVMTFIINNMTKLSNLKIPFIHTDPPQHTIESLKSLTIGWIENAEDFESFITHQVNLERLKLEWMTTTQEDSNEEIGFAVANLHKLERLFFGPGFTPTNRILETIKENCPKLSLLEFNKPEQPLSADILNEINGRGLRVYEYSCDSLKEKFKRHKTMWEEEDATYPIDPDFSDDENDDSDDMMFDNDDDMDFDDDDDFFDGDDFGFHPGSDSDDDDDFFDPLMRHIFF